MDSEKVEILWPLFNDSTGFLGDRFDFDDPSPFASRTSVVSSNGRLVISPTISQTAVTRSQADWFCREPATRVTGHGRETGHGCGLKVRYGSPIEIPASVPSRLAR